MRISFSFQNVSLKPCFNVCSIGGSRRTANRVHDSWNVFWCLPVLQFWLGVLKTQTNGRGPKYNFTMNCQATTDFTVTLRWNCSTNCWCSHNPICEAVWRTVYVVCCIVHIFSTRYALRPSNSELATEISQKSESAASKKKRSVVSYARKSRIRSRWKMFWYSLFNVKTWNSFRSVLYIASNYGDEYTKRSVFGLKLLKSQLRSSQVVWHWKFIRRIKWINIE